MKPERESFRVIATLTEHSGKFVIIVKPLRAWFRRGPVLSRLPDVPVMVIPKYLKL